jgi:7-carboxy-7-deazaguanine synthase
MSKIKVSEVFASVQGEGVNMGKPAIFLRLSGCNLRCRWCDSIKKWRGGKWISIEEVFFKIAKLIKTSKIYHLVITGGEPLLQQNKIYKLLCKLKKVYAFTTELETNGTIKPFKKLVNLIDYFSVSPKLAFSGNKFTRRIKTNLLGAYAKMPNAFFKFVVDKKNHLIEVETIVNKCKIPKNRIFLMPQAKTKAQLLKKTKLVKALARQFSCRFSGRLHIRFGLR